MGKSEFKLGERRPVYSHCRRHSRPQSRGQVGWVISMTADTGASADACAHGRAEISAARRANTVNLCQQTLTRCSPFRKYADGLHCSRRIHLSKCRRHRARWIARQPVRGNVPEPSALKQLRDPYSPIRAKFGVPLPNQRSELPQARHGHSHGGARSDSGSRSRLRVIPNGRSDAANVRLVLFPIEGWRPLRTRCKCAPTPGGWHRVGGQRRGSICERVVRVRLRHVGEQHLSYRGAIERNESANQRKNRRCSGESSFST